MRYEQKWQYSAMLMQKVLARLGGKHRELCSILGVSRSFIEMMLRGERGVPAAHAKTLARLKILPMEAFLKAYLEDVENTYRVDMERSSKPAA